MTIKQLIEELERQAKVVGVEAPVRVRIYNSRNGHQDGAKVVETQARGGELILCVE